jgi:hypothetical protein
VSLVNETVGRFDWLSRRSLDYSFETQACTSLSNMRAPDDADIITLTLPFEISPDRQRRAVTAKMSACWHWRNSGGGVAMVVRRCPDEILGGLLMYCNPHLKFWGLQAPNPRELRPCLLVSMGAAAFNIRCSLSVTTFGEPTRSVAN